MKIDDVNAFKGAVKDAVVSWGNKKIEELFKGRPIEQFAKKGLRNIIAREDEKINRYVDNAFLFLADETGAVDSDTVIDDVCAMFVNMKETTYPMGPVNLKVGGGEVAVNLPHNFLLDMMTGGMGVIKFTKEDFLELKNYF